LLTIGETIEFKPGKPCPARSGCPQVPGGATGGIDQQVATAKADRWGDTVAADG
jgi:hypothetical protein